MLEKLFTIEWVKNEDGTRTFRIGWGFLLMIAIGLYLLFR